MERVEFDIEQLDIRIYTNIANSDEQLVKFTRSMLHIPKTDEEDTEENVLLVDLPYFTSDIEYPLSKLNFM